MQEWIIMNKWIIFLGSIFFLNGCAEGPVLVTQPSPPQSSKSVRRVPPAQQINLSGFPPAYKQGYSDGCNTAQSILHSIKDEKRYKADGQYAQGWQDGKGICGAKKR